MEAQLYAAEQQIQELQSQLHHKDMRVAKAEAAQRSAESERDAVAQEAAKLEEQVSRHQQVTALASPPDVAFHLLFGSYFQLGSFSVVKLNARM